MGAIGPFGYPQGMRTVPTRTIALAFFGAALFAGCTNEGPSNPFINIFSCTPSDLPDGPGPVTITWAVSGAVSLTIAPTVGAVTPVNNGSTIVQVPATTTYTLTATSLNGTSTTTCLVTVNTAPVINLFTATPSDLDAGGGPVTLTWNVTGATALSISPGVGTVNPDDAGMRSLLVGTSTDFVLTATNSAGSKMADAGVTVGLPATNPTVIGTVVDNAGQPIPGETVNHFVRRL